MILKSIKWMVVGGVALVVAGGVLFGTELGSYVRSSAKSVRTAVKDSVPVEFELRRARDFLDDIIPEMQANIRLVAQQEVEIESLRADITQSGKSLGDEQAKVAKLRNCLTTIQTSFAFNGLNYDREQLKEELARRFDHYKEAEVILTGKKRLLDTREKGLVAAVQKIEKTRGQKLMLENQIAALEGQFRLVQAASAGSSLHIDNSKLAQTEKLIAQVKKQLDVAERVLAHEAKFTEAIEVDTVNEKDLVTAVDEHFAPRNAEQKLSAEQPSALSKNNQNTW